MKKEIDLESPIFSVYVIDDKLIVACGGGNPKCGKKNKIILYKMESGYIDSKPLFEEDSGDNLPQYLDGIQSKRIFGYCAENKIYFYSLEQEGNKFNKLYTLDIVPKKTSLECFKIDGNLLVSGSELGGIKLFEIDYSGEGINKITELCSEEDAHYKSINKIELIDHEKTKVILTASGDGYCKLFGINKKGNNYSLNLISNFSFRQFPYEPSNYFMRDIIYNKEDSTIYTLQSPEEGSGFLTKWSSININYITPIKTIKISDSPCPSFSITKDRKYIGITDKQGKIIFVNAKDLKVTGSKKIGNDMLKYCSFYQNYLISGSISYILSINKLCKGSNTKIFSVLLHLLLIAGIVYYVYLKKNNLISED